MVSATVPIGATEGIEGTHGYTYDALGRRVSKSIHDGGNVDTTIFVTSGDQGVGEYAADESTGAVSKQYLYGSYIDELVATMQTPSGNRHYYHHNSLFTVSALTDTSGAVTERYAFDPYGSLLFLDASGSLTPTQASSAGNPYGFTGRVRDLETRLWYFRARYVDSRVGRFISRDPLMYGDGANLYQYAQSAPLHSLDPSGLATCTKWVKKSRPCTKLDDQMCNLSCTAQGHVSGKMTVCYTYVRTCTSWCWGTYLEEKSGGNCQCTTNVWVCVCPPPPKGCTLLGNTNTQNKKIPSGPCLCAYSCIGQSGKPYFTPPKPGTWTLNGTTTL